MRGEVRSELSEAAQARLRLGRAEAGGDKTDEEAVAAVSRIDAARDLRVREQIVEKHTGKPATEVEPAVAQRALRDEALDQQGLGEALESRVGDRLDDSDEEVAEDLAEPAACTQVAENYDKPVDQVTAADLAAYRTAQEDAAVEGLTGKPVEDLSALELLQARSAVRNADVDARLAARKDGGGRPADGMPIVGEVTPSFYRAADGTWYDMDGNPLSATGSAHLESAYRSGSLQPTGEARAPRAGRRRPRARTTRGTVSRARTAMARVRRVATARAGTAVTAQGTTPRVPRTRRTCSSTPPPARPSTTRRWAGRAAPARRSTSSTRRTAA